jgi:predicted DsbA family dithiol-disulfide isomerase
MRRWLSVVALLVVVVGVIALPSACAPPVPGAIRDEMLTTASLRRGAVTVVFFTDFQCPYCRATHRALAPLLSQRGDGVRVVLRHVPLPRHPDARGAALAAVCFEKLAGPARGEDGRRAYLGYTHALFEAPDLSPTACADLAVERGVDRAAFDACVASPEAVARIHDDEAIFDAVHGDGVPLIYIGKTRLEGAQPPEALAEALDDAAHAAHAAHAAP